MVRGSYHLYQGVGGLVGNMAMGVVFVLLYRRWGRVRPLVAAHALIDTIAFVGYALLAGKVGWLPTLRSGSPSRAPSASHAVGEPALDDGHGGAGEQHPLTAQRGGHQSATRRDLEPVSSLRPSRSDHSGASAVCALPVTGSSLIPTAGPKKRETKS